MCSPAAIGGQASRCAGVGPSGKAPANQSRTGPESDPSASLASMSIVCIPAVMGHPGPIGSLSRNRLSLGSKTARGRNQEHANERCKAWEQGDAVKTASSGLLRGISRPRVIMSGKALFFDQQRYHVMAPRKCGWPFASPLLVSRSELWLCFRLAGSADPDLTPARKFRMLLHINPTRQRGKRTGSLARALGWYMTFFAAGVIYHAGKTRHGKSPMTRSKPLGPSFTSGKKHQREYSR